MHDLPTLVLIALFLLSAGVVLASGRPLANTTAILSRRYGLGQALGGMLILALVTDLPELAIIVSAATRGDLSLAVGNLLGGTAAQMMVLVVLDRAQPGSLPLSTRASSATLKVECLLVIVLLLLVITGPALAHIEASGPVSLPDILTPVIWLAGLLWIGRLRPATAGGGQQPMRKHGDATVAVFILSALVTFAGGVGLEVMGDALAERFEIGGILFGATVLAAATALPELSTGWASAKAGDNELAVSDIMGGNAVLPVLLTPASLIAGTTAYAHIDATSIYLSGVGVVMTAIYALALIWRPRRRWLGFAPECIALVAIYITALWMMAGL